MRRTETSLTYRFVVVYRAEAREIAGAAAVWRGWVEQVPDPRSSEDAALPNPRLGFQELTELPGLLLELIGKPGVEPEAERQRRNS